MRSRSVTRRSPRSGRRRVAWSRCGLGAARVGGEHDPVGGVFIELNVDLALVVRGLVEKEAGDGGRRAGELYSSTVEAVAIKAVGDKLPAL